MSALVGEAVAVCVCGSEHLCECGCGEGLNPNLRRAHELVAAGATHRAAAEIIGISRAAVSILFQKPPRYVKGHLSVGQREIARTKALASNAQARQLRQSAHRRYLRECVAREIEAGTFPWWIAPSNWRWAIVVEDFPDEMAHALAERERKRAEVEVRKAERIAERERKRAVKAARWWQRSARPNPYMAVSLDAPLMFDEFEGSRHLTVASTTSLDPIEQAHRDRLWEIVGDTDIATLGEHELVRLRERLLREGFAPPSVQSAERERLRDPDHHAGASITKSKGRGSKRTRKAQQQVTREHHVRDLPTWKKREHAQFRRSRQRDFVTWDSE